MKLNKYEKETIILTSEGDDTYSVYTFNPTLKRRLADFAKKYPAVCRLESEDKKLGFRFLCDGRRSKSNVSKVIVQGRSDECNFCDYF